MSTRPVQVLVLTSGCGQITPLKVKLLQDSSTSTKGCICPGAIYIQASLTGRSYVRWTVISREAEGCEGFYDLSLTIAHSLALILMRL